MIWLSLAVFFLMCVVHLPFDHTVHRAISRELADANPLAWLLMGGLCGVTVFFAHRLKRSGHTLRTWLLLLDALGICVIAFSPPTSQTHEIALCLVVALTIFWFTGMALDYNCQGLLILSAASVILLLFLSAFSIGVAEKGLILYCLVNSNFLYYGFLQDENEAHRRLWN